MGRVWFQKSVIGLFVLILFSSFVIADVIFRDDENIGMVLKSPKIIKQIGFEQNFRYKFDRFSETEWQIEVCHKDFDTNKNKKLKDNKGLDEYPILKPNGKQPQKNKLDLKNKQCDTVVVELMADEMVKFGEETTEIIIDDANITMLISPETYTCIEKSCESTISIFNYADSPISINSSDLTVSVENVENAVLSFWNGTELTKEAQQITIEPSETFTFYLQAQMADFGLWKYNVTLNYMGVHTIDPYFNTTNTSPPRSEFNTPTGQVILPSAIFNISGDALDYYNLTDVTYEVTKPDLTKTNYTLPIQSGFDAYRDNPNFVATDNFATYFGDFNSVHVRLGRYLIRYPQDIPFNRVAFEINSMVGDPYNANLLYDVTICPTNSNTLTVSTLRDANCTSPPVIVGDAINLSQQIGSSQSGMFELLKLQNIFNMTNSTKYIMAFEYDSGFVNDGANDFWSLKVDAFSSPPNNYGRVLNTNSTFFTDVLPHLRLFRDYNLTYSDTTIQGNYTVKLFATDFHGNTNSSETITFRVCEHNWTAQLSSCFTNDTQIKTYIDSNDCPIGDPVPGDNGTYIFCNYCSASLSKQYVSNCTFSGIINYTWQDSNYLSCCAVTNDTTDCMVDFDPYNGTHTEACSILENDFVLDLDLELYFGFGFGGLHSDKVGGKIYINDTNNTYTCLSYVKTLGGQLVQTNPSYTRRIGSVLQIVPKEYEDREFFITNNGLANVYWTSDNLVIDGRQYIFGVECAGDGNNLKSEQVATVEYEPLNSPITRWFWAMDNTMSILLLVLVVVVIVMIIYWIVRVSR